MLAVPTPPAALSSSVTFKPVSGSVGVVVSAE